MEKSNNDKARALLLLVGILLIALFAILNFISNRFSREIPLIEQPVLILVSLLVLAGALYFSVYFILDRIPGTAPLIWIVAVGTALRVMMLFSTPVLEDDYFRYFWDGAVSANGVNPYAYSPEEVLENKGTSQVPAKLRDLAEESGKIIHNINHPNLRTVYPLTSQMVLAATYLIKPWSMISWRVTLLLFDFVALALLIYVFRFLRLPSIGLAIYWWNPLLIKEIYNSGHLDLVAFPFVLGALVLLAHSRHLSSLVSLALAVGVKIWPLLLFPMILRPLINRPRQLIAALGLFLALLLVLFLPVYVAGLDESSGFNAYFRTWENNSSLFKLILWGTQSFLSALEIHPGHGQHFARLAVLVVMVLWVGSVSYRRAKHPSEIFWKCLLILAAAFLISPTQFPWYYTILLPFLAIHPRPSLLLLTVLLPLYYLRYYFEPRGLLEISTKYIPWIEFVPVWILIFIEWYAGPRAKLMPNLDKH